MAKPALLFPTILTLILLVSIDLINCETKCWKRKFYVTTLLGSSGKGTAFNATVSCPEYYSWTINDYCCYDGYDRFDRNPFCCYSETYKLAVAVGLICLVLLGISCSFFLCWVYNIPHYILIVLTCGKFSLNDYMKKTILNGPYVDPSFYTGEPFWSSANSQIQPYPLRPMPPGIFYPTGSVMKSRWSNQHLMSTGQMPLFVIASRQFTRNPYSARPSERQTSVCSASSFTGRLGGGGTIGGGADSRRSSTTSNYKADNRVVPTLNFKVNIDEVEAAAELLDALKKIENKDKNFAIPKLVEETQNDLDLLDESDAAGRGIISRKDSLKDGTTRAAAAAAPNTGANNNSTKPGRPGTTTGNTTSIRVGSSNHTNIIPLKSRNSSISESNSSINNNNNPMNNGKNYHNRSSRNLLEEKDESDEDDDDEEESNDEDDEAFAQFVVPIKTTVTNELGNHHHRNVKLINEAEADIYPLESVEVENDNIISNNKKDNNNVNSKEPGAGRGRKKSTITLGNTQESSSNLAAEVTTDKRDIPGLISE